MSKVKYRFLRYTDLSISAHGVAVDGEGVPTLHPVVNPAVSRCSFDLEEKLLAAIEKKQKERLLAEQKKKEEEERIRRLSKEEERRKQEEEKKAALEKKKAIEDKTKLNTIPTTSAAAVSVIPSGTAKPTGTPITVEPVRVLSSELDPTVPIVQVQVMPLPSTSTSKVVTATASSSVAVTVKKSSVVASKPVTINTGDPEEKSLNQDQKKSLDTFLSILNYNDRKKAIQLLEFTNWDVSRAMDNFYSHQGNIDMILAGNEHNGRVGSPKSPS
eukprot:jgi/Bigna1/71395/fgenesh1_pg.15_\